MKKAVCVVDILDIPVGVSQAQRSQYYGAIRETLEYAKEHSSPVIWSYRSPGLGWDRCFSNMSIKEYFEMEGTPDATQYDIDQLEAINEISPIPLRKLFDRKSMNNGDPRYYSKKLKKTLQKASDFIVVGSALWKEEAGYDPMTGVKHDDFYTGCVFDMVEIVQEKRNNLGGKFEFILPGINYDGQLTPQEMSTAVRNAEQESVRSINMLSFESTGYLNEDINPLSHNNTQVISCQGQAGTNIS